MIDPANVPAVADDELLARFVTQRTQFRPGDNTVKPDVFIPHPRLELSVTRHLDASEAEIWSVGYDVAAKLARSLYGRVDVLAGNCRRESLLVDPMPLPNNPNHADISDWPPLKQDQKLIALKLALTAGTLVSPPAVP